MKQEEIDTLWFKALDESVKQGELYTRYHFAALVAAYIREIEFKPDWNNYRQGLVDGAAAEREECAAICDTEADEFGGMSDGFYAAKNCAEAIRTRGGDA